MKPSWIFLALLLPVQSLFAFELPLPNQPHLVIEGHGSIKQVPDIVKINFEVSATESNSALAKKKVDTIIAKAIKAARQQKIKKDDINASKIHASPQYDWTKGERIYKGERVTRNVELTLKKADRYNALVDSLLEAGISRLQNVTMDFSNREALEKKAMKLALENAKQQASNISGALGEKLGGIFQVAPVNHGVMIPHGMAMRANDVMEKKSAGLELGKQTVETRVRVVYLLGQ